MIINAVFYYSTSSSTTRAPRTDMIRNDDDVVLDMVENKDSDLKPMPSEKSFGCTQAFRTVGRPETKRHVPIFALICGASALCTERFL